MMSFLCPRPTVREGLSGHTDSAAHRHHRDLPRAAYPGQGRGEVVLRKPVAGFSISRHSKKRNSGQETLHTHTQEWGSEVAPAPLASKEHPTFRPGRSQERKRDPDGHAPACSGEPRLAEQPQGCQEGPKDISQRGCVFQERLGERNKCIYLKDNYTVFKNVVQGDCDMGKANDTARRFGARRWTRHRRDQPVCTSSNPPALPDLLLRTAAGKVIRGILSLVNL